MEALRPVLRPKTLLHIRLTNPRFSTSSTWRSARKLRPMSDFTFSFSQSLARPSPPRSSLGLSLARAYSNGPGLSYMNRSVSNACWTIIALNTAVYGAWYYATANENRNLERDLFRHFTLSQKNMDDGRYWTTITSAFSHKDFGHFFFNMFALQLFGSILSGVPGVRVWHLWSLYLGGAAAGSYGWLGHQKSLQKGKPSVKNTIWSRFQNLDHEQAGGLGASGAAMGLTAAATFVWPWARVGLFFVPVPLWVASAGIFAVDWYYLNNETDKIGHAAHLGGAVFGTIFYGVFLRRFGIGWLPRRR